MKANIKQANVLKQKILSLIFDEHGCEVNAAINACLFVIGDIVARNYDLPEERKATMRLIEDSVPVMAAEVERMALFYTAAEGSA
jgi:hypothetical protein